MGRSISRAAIALPLLLAASNIVAEEDVFKDAPGFYVELTGPNGETKQEIRSVENTPTVKAVNTGARSGTYGPLKSSDTMWSIASKTRPNNSVSVHQMMTAIFNKNPQAFLNNDINRLVNGAVLSIPTLAEIQGIDKDAAKQKFIADTQPAKVATKATPAPTPAPTVAPTVAPTAVPSIAPEVAPEAPVETANTAKEVAPKEAVAPARSTELDELKTQLDDSNQQLLQVAESNQRMKMKLEALSTDLDSLKTQLQEDSKVQLEIKELLSQQLANNTPAQAQAEEQAESDDLLKLLTSSWLYLGAVIALPILIILVIISFWLRAKTKREAEEQEQEIATSTSALMEEKSEYDDLLAGEQADDEPVVKPEEPQFSLDDDLKADELTNANLASDDINLMSEIDLDSDNDEPRDTGLDLDFDSKDNEADISAELDMLAEQTSDADSFDFDFNAAEAEAEDETEKPVELEDEDLFASTDVSSELALDDANEPEIDFSNSVADLEVEPEPVAESNSDDILSAEDLANIEFEEADDSLFELQEENHLVQDEEMIVELDDEDDILLDELSPSAMDDDLVADLASTAEPKGATDLEEFDFNMSETPESEPDTALDFDTSKDTLAELDDSIDDIADLTLDANESSQDGSDINDLDWDFAEIDTVDEPADSAEITEVDDIEDTDLLASQLGEIAFNEPTEPVEVPKAADVSDDYIDIERLLEESGDESNDEPYQGANFDIGLDEFPDVLPETGGIDVDIDEGGIGQKLDLARAYLEIDDKEGAKSILEEIQGQGSEDQIAEITKLLNRLG
ncbi:FimV/HubP family polar landmark protein [Motilimonas sp. KMU-193]|uniref:FimV/HubP family polar landmark protein n=1 Tax=Motilimonas sp. KMU-193 TaxID=3388668 RepID=UPI00396B19DD